MNPQFTPKVIQEKLTKNQITKREAGELFVQVLEKSSDEKIRIETLDLIDKTILGSEETFKLLEDLLISDENTEIRVRTIKRLARDFPKESIKPFEWAIQHDTSGTVLMTIREVVDSSDLPEYEILKEVLSIKLSKLSDEWGVVPLETLFLLDLQDQIEWCNLEFFKKYRSDILFFVIYDEATYFCVRRKHIIGLNLCAFGIPNIPDTICFLSKLRFLNLSSNWIQYLPQKFSKLKRLRSLDLSNNHLNNLPDFWHGLLSLQDLRIKNNLNIGKIPHSIYKFVQRNNAKRYIKEGVSPNEASILGLFELFTHVGLVRCEESDNFWLDCEFCYRVNSEGHVIGLTIIGQEGFNLSFIPEKIGDLEFLEELNLMWNSIKEIPESIGKLRRLKILNLAHNRVLKFPNSMKNLTSLEEIWIDHSLRSKLPKFLKEKVR